MTIFTRCLWPEQVLVYRASQLSGEQVTGVDDRHCHLAGVYASGLVCASVLEVQRIDQLGIRPSDEK